MKIRKNTPMRSKVLSVFMAAVMALAYVLSFTEVSFAASPTVLADETVYVNLDYYGETKNVSIVKGCDLNGNKSFTDYGNYLSVTNMSGYDKPVLSFSGVTWHLNHIKDNKRFYYQCGLENNAIEFPWFIDVSYKLDGVPVEAEKLAGASGLIEIDIKVTPNKKTKAYYRNNMLLQVGTTVDMEDNYSLDAPGSQLQSAGSKKVVLFAALPGEEDTYAIRIGTNCFETDGITAMMIPGTMSALKDIKDLKESKDDVEDAADDIYAATNEMLLTMESMNNGLSALKEGTQGMDDARRHFSAGDDEMYTDFDTAMEDLNRINNQLKNITPYFATCQRMIRSINKNLNQLSNSLEDLEDPLDDTNDSISTMKNDLSDLKKMMAALNAQMGEMIKNSAAAASTPYEAAEVQGAAQMATTLSQHMNSINSLISETIEMGNTTKEIIGITYDLIDETADLTDTADQYEDDMLDMLDDMEELTSLTSSSLNSAIALMTYSKNLMQETSGIMDPAMEKTFAGMIEFLEKSTANMDDIAAMRKANTTIKRTIDHQFDKFEDENKFLYLDAEASLQSFTSDKNPAPLSTQILLRTAEISLDDDNDIDDEEMPKKDIGVWNRIKEVFVEILNGLEQLIE